MKSKQPFAVYSVSALGNHEMMLVTFEQPGHQ